MAWHDGYKTTYSYDDLGRVATISEVDGGVTSLLASYSYDTLSRRTGVVL